MRSSTETEPPMREDDKQYMDSNQGFTVDILSMSKHELGQFLRKESKDNPLLDLVDKHPGNGTEEAIWGLEQKQDFQESSFESPLVHFLETQLLSRALEPGLYRGALELIGCLNASGYLECSFEDLQRKLGLDKNELEEAVKTVQGLDPAGIGARSLQECLFLQARRYCPEDRTLLRIIQDHLDLGLENKAQLLAIRMNENISDISGSLAVLRTLNIRPIQALPAGILGGTPEADVLVKHKRGRYQVVINESQVPIPVMSNYYQILLRIEQEDAELRTFLNKKLKRTLGIIKNYENRNETLRRIVEVLLEEQKYLVNPKAKKIRLTMTEVANRIGCSVSTVSRAVKGKYMETPCGIFSFRKIFMCSEKKSD